MEAHEGTFMSLFTRQSGGQRVLPSQDSEDTQQQSPGNLVVLTYVQLKSFYRLSTHDITHVRKCTRASPAFLYCKRRKAGRGLGTRLGAPIGAEKKTPPGLRGAIFGEVP